MKNILIIEDCNLVRLEIRNILEKNGFSEIMELNSADLISKMPELYLNSVMLIILDIELPGISGIDLAHQLKKHPVYSNIPIIFISGNNYSEVVNKAINAGGIDYIVKPFNSSLLIERIKRVINIFCVNKKELKENFDNKIINSIIDECEWATRECMDIFFLVFNSETNDIENAETIIKNDLQEISKVLISKNKIIAVLPLTFEKNLSILTSRIKEIMLKNKVHLEFSKAVPFKFSEENNLGYLKKELLQ